MTTKETLSNRPVFNIGGKFAALDSKDTAARLALFLALQDAGVGADDLNKGPSYNDLHDGYLVAWQGARFAKLFAKAKGDVGLTGRVLDVRTGEKIETTMRKDAWQRALSSKLSKLRQSYRDWLGATQADDTDDGADDGADDKGKGKTTGRGARSNEPRPIGVRVLAEVNKLALAVQKDQASEKPAKISHEELIAAFHRIAGILGGALKLK